MNPALPDRADVVIIGGGVTGVSIACHLARLGQGGVLLLERGDLGQGATAKTVGGLRTQFSTEINIRLSLMSREVFERFEADFGLDPGFRRIGYLFLARTQVQWRVLENNARLMAGLELDVELLDPDGLKQRWPWLEVSDLIGGSYTADDGYLSPHEVLQGFARGARRGGARLVEHTAVAEILTLGRAVAGVVTDTGHRIETPSVVLAAGAWAALPVEKLGIELPVRPYRRQVFFTAPFDLLPPVFPLTVDLGSGWYMRREGPGLLLSGPRDEESGFSEAVDFAGREWAAAMSMARVPILEQARIARGWAGLYDLTPDHHAILGQAPELKGLYLACGFSGHGFQHSPAVGRLMAELVAFGQARSLDLHPLRPERFRENDLVHESLVAFQT
ncbi:MAG: FAD-binding oxidoreductase [Proteobacteria bacterium]|nr:FAD-binding oxidoreductase [Pseudomonadota bacterium]